MKLIKLLLILIFVAVISGCSQGQGTVNSSPEVSEEYAISFTDDDGNEIKMQKPAERIISLYSAHTENIYYLGAGEKLIGNYKTGTWPPEAAFLEMYDYSGDPESIIAAKPDVVIIRPFVTRKAPDYVNAIKNAGIEVVSLYPDKFEEFDEYIEKLAMVTGTEGKASELLENFHNELDSIKAVTENIENKQTIFFESTETEVRTVTSDSMAGLAIQLAGGINIAADAEPIESGSSIAAFGAENVLINADNIDVYVSQRGAMNSGASEQGIAERSGFEVIKALKDGRFFTINEKIISSPSFRYVKGVKELARYLYPDVMDTVVGYENDEKATRRSFAEILFNKFHLPIYVPSSSSYYQSEHNGHVFGMFDDIEWNDPQFDVIEAVCAKGYIQSEKDGEKESFLPDNAVTRDDLARAVFLLGDFSPKENVEISDISESKHQKMVETLVQNGIFKLEDGKFLPNEELTNNEIIETLDFVKFNFDLSSKN